VLASVGVYGLISYAVALRGREIGIRMALGAAPRQILIAVLRQGLALAVAGIAIGFGISLMLTRVLASLLFEVSPRDLPTCAVVGLVLTSVALIACYFPARRAATVDPMAALRDQ
jgi:ABC-type antimicrobial peptide transport system permease subunit